MVVPGESSLIARLATSLIVGRSLTELTVTRNVPLVVAKPSLTVIVIVAVPNWLVVGRTVTVRAAPLPPSTMFAFGISAGLDDAADTFRLAAAVSTSPIVK